MTFRRGFGVRPGETALVVEDVITTGKSSQEVIDLVSARGGRVSAALSIVDRSPKDPALSVPVRSLVRLEIATFRPEDCPQCRAGTPFLKPGSRPTVAS
jgi:orotate phosphoribosyltransferase